ncbi:MAG: tetratricopeptide repeat protein [Nevskiaceae bacterium]|nr:MAG: tetratricopeptide repeat protein [Nevskiaceae bacterium]TBR72623.1 MAG: tetratricopeptide repeat protein [Nevskiaceae bacterium]
MTAKLIPSLVLLCAALSLIPAARAATATNAPAPSSYVTRAQGQMAQGDLKGALATLNDYLATAPQDANARFAKGLVLTRLGQTQDAAKIFTGLTQDYPQLPEPYNNLAVLYAKQGQYDKARDALKAALATHPSYATAAENLGDVYAAMAARAYDQALKLDKNNSQIQYKLALVNRLDSETGSIAAPAAPAPAAPTETASAAATTAPGAVEPATAPAPAQPTADAGQQDAVVAAVQGWAKAWSSQDVAAYIRHYAPDFKGSSKSHKAWVDQRRQRLSAPSHISVKLSKVEVTMEDADTATATFMQHYASNTLDNTARKTLRLKHRGNAWKIVSESNR